MGELTIPEAVCFITALLILARGLVFGLEVEDAGVAMFLMGLVPIRRADKKGKD